MHVTIFFVRSFAYHPGTRSVAVLSLAGAHERCSQVTWYKRIVSSLQTHAMINACQVLCCVQPCNCKAEDFYCEYGYEKTTSNSKCEKMDGADSAPVCQAIEIEAYKQSKSNMRLAHGEVCPNLGDFIPDTDGNVRSYLTLLLFAVSCAASEMMHPSQHVNRDIRHTRVAFKFEGVLSFRSCAELSEYNKTHTCKVDCRATWPSTNGVKPTLTGMPKAERSAREVTGGCGFSVSSWCASAALQPSSMAHLPCRTLARQCLREVSAWRCG